jgi:hypothetical protein
MEASPAQAKQTEQIHCQDGGVLAATRDPKLTVGFRLRRFNWKKNRSQ